MEEAGLDNGALGLVFRACSLTHCCPASAPRPPRVRPARAKVSRLPCASCFLLGRSLLQLLERPQLIPRQPARRPLAAAQIEPPRRACRLASPGGQSGGRGEEAGRAPGAGAYRLSAPRSLPPAVGAGQLRARARVLPQGAGETAGQLQGHLPSRHCLLPPGRLRACAPLPAGCAQPGAHR